jgi:hypothetical protein
MPLMRSSGGKPETVELLLNERGRADLLDKLGPDALSVEGVLVSRADSSISVTISSVTSISKAVAKWGGEPLTVQMNQLRDVRLKRLSMRKTVVAIGAVVGAGLAFVVTRALGGRGDAPGERIENPNPS